MSERRTLLRRFGDVLHYPLSAIEGKYGRRRGLSAFRIVVLTLLWMFVANWPPYPWGLWEWATFASLLFAIPLSDLLMAVPAKEALLAITAVFGSIASKRTRLTESSSTTTEEVNP